MVSIDQFTKWVEILALPDQKAHTGADALLNEVIARYGCPLTIHTDQGRNFTYIDTGMKTQSLTGASGVGAR